MTTKEWSGSPCPYDPANFWIDDETGERVSAITGERSAPHPTANQIRAYYKNQGYEVRIAKDGHVTFRKDGGAWLEGRWVFEYRLINGSVVLV